MLVMLVVRKTSKWEARHRDDDVVTQINYTIRVHARIFWEIFH